MIKHLQKIGNSRGIVIDKPVLDLLNINDDTALEITQKDGGIFLKPISSMDAYSKIAKKHRKSLDKLAK